MSDSFIVIAIIIAVVMYIIGSFSTVQKSAKKPLRKQGLNDLKETLPRTHKAQSDQKLPTYTNKPR
ncbi:MAG: hypothetical protein MK214_01700 [Thalassotalea sp.]|nr:hypothetical protein [Thalassotalea sp.]